MEKILWTIFYWTILVEREKKKKQTRIIVKVEVSRCEMIQVDRWIRMIFFLQSYVSLNFTLSLAQSRSSLVTFGWRRKIRLGKASVGKRLCLRGAGSQQKVESPRWSGLQEHALPKRKIEWCIGIGIFGRPVAPPWSFSLRLPRLIYIYLGPLDKHSEQGTRISTRLPGFQAISTVKPPSLNERRSFFRVLRIIIIGTIIG